MPKLLKWDRRRNLLSACNRPSSLGLVGEVLRRRNLWDPPDRRGKNPSPLISDYISKIRNYFHGVLSLLWC